MSENYTSELVFGLVGAVGTDLKRVADCLKEVLKRQFSYDVSCINVSSEIIPHVLQRIPPNHEKDEYSRISTLMNWGNECRIKTQNSAILSLAVAGKINQIRQSQSGESEPTIRVRSLPQFAFLINSLKHPSEVKCLRDIYQKGFFLLGVYSDDHYRRKFLVDQKRVDPEKADLLMERDQKEESEYGQRVVDTFHLSDAFIALNSDETVMQNSIFRILQVLFGNPYITPTFDEYAMFMAHGAALRSADLSRQVGAVIGREKEIIATGANDCPKFDGGLYWPIYDENEKMIKDELGGRDHTLGYDSNKKEQLRIVDDIVSRVIASGVDERHSESIRQSLSHSLVTDITEYGRVVHAEMEALSCCARNHVSARGATLYSTTFPCHNCAKHIIAAGIHRVVFIEPYPKSKAGEFYKDSITIGLKNKAENKVAFEPFIGIGPRLFFDLFSMKLGDGVALKRKNDKGEVLDWSGRTTPLSPRIPLLHCSYLDLEEQAAQQAAQYVTGVLGRLEQNIENTSEG